MSKYIFNIKDPLNAMHVAATHKPHAIFPPMKGHASLADIPGVAERLEDSTLNIDAVNKFGHKVVNDMYFYFNDSEVALLNATCSVDFSNNILVTPMVGGRGSVKELIAIEDMSISINGFISDDNDTSGKYPYEKVNSFYKLFKNGSNFKVNSKWLNLFDITKVVVKSINFPLQQGGYTNMQYFSMEMLSDDDFPLIVK